MKEIKIAFPQMDLRDLVEGKVKYLAFTTDEHGEPIRVEISAYRPPTRHPSFDLK